MSKLRVGIIGLGVGERHIAGYREHPGCEVSVLCDYDEDKLREVAARYPGIATKTAAEEMLDDSSIDAVSIATYDNFHFEQAARAIRNGKHVFVEKPMCLHEEEARQLRELLSQHPEVVLSSNLVLRMSPRFASLKGMIEAGELGDLFYVEADYNYGRLHKLTEGWRGRLDYYSVVHGGAVHMVDLLLWLTGDTIVEVQAFGNRICSRDAAFRFNDMAVACLRFESGMVGKVTANFGCVMPHFHGLAVYGSRGTFVNERECGRLYQSRDPADAAREIRAEYPGVNKGDLIRSFVDAIQKGTRPVVTADDAFRAMSVCFAIERATRQPGAVEVSYL
ncbi:MAG: Gfo/Idh/MocA family oxidoreductase [Planctomycetes bacterium]|nr:Gfo/Idh/MocA family oxidoreductase [Planctomycetota bacterium]